MCRCGSEEYCSEEFISNRIMNLVKDWGHSKRLPWDPVCSCETARSFLGYSCWIFVLRCMTCPTLWCHFDISAGGIRMYFSDARAPYFCITLLYPATIFQFLLAETCWHMNEKYANVWRQNVCFSIRITITNYGLIRLIRFISQISLKVIWIN